MLGDPGQECRGEGGSLVSLFALPLAVGLLPWVVKASSPQLVTRP